MTKDLILIIADSPILNPREIIPYPNLSTNYSVYLNTLLFSNWMDIFSAANSQIEISTYLSEKDKEYIPKYLLPSGSNAIFYQDDSFQKNLAERILHQSSTNNFKILVLSFNSIGIKMDEIQRIFSLIQTDEPSVVIGKSESHKINCICAKSSDVELFDLLIKSKRNYDDYLQLVSNKDYFIHSVRNFLSIDNFEDIKKLYIELSKKESLSYCSPKMHESFNDLFIEYKELLNV